MDVLLVSNLRGKSRDSGDQRQALDKSKVDAIYSKSLSLLQLNQTACTMSIELPLQNVLPVLVLLWRLCIDEQG